ncbi:F-box protein family-like [Zostera marina]|uniref:F-box protein family-like n=1 Tax=Zostera marina TaxID=29655 RepID=A0A0K9PZZ4_ZOSMR|nr:F-box protein family-like [Zostera marina]
MQSKTRIHALDQSHHSILTDLFDHIPDALLLVIFNKIGDVRSLGRCACVSKRFNVHIHLVHNVHMKIDQVVSVDGDEAMNLPLPKPRNFLSHFFKLFFNILRPFNHICNCNSGNKTLLPQVSHHSPAQVLNNFTNIQNVTIELPSSDVGTENGVVLKWRAVFGSTLQNCVILGGIRTERKVPDQIVVSDLVEEDNNSSNGVLPESFYTNGGLKLRVVAAFAYRSVNEALLYAACDQEPSISQEFDSDGCRWAGNTEHGSGTVEGIQGEAINCVFIN